MDIGPLAVDERGERAYMVVNAGGGGPSRAPASPWVVWLRRLYEWLPVVPAPTLPPPGRGTATLFDTMR